MKQLTYLLATGITLAGLSGCSGGGGGGTGTVETGKAMVQPEDIDKLILNLKSYEATANSFAISQCKMLGPQAAAAIPALEELKVREAADADVVALIDEAIAAIQGGGAAATP